MASHRFREVIWWKKWTIPAAGLILVAFVLIITLDDSYWSSWTEESDSTLRPAAVTGINLVGLTLLKNTKNKGAVCLDGSAPGYHFQRGSGSGSENWVLHIEGGGWCDTIESCSLRKSTALGSSDFMDIQVPFAGIF